MIRLLNCEYQTDDAPKPAHIEYRKVFDTVAETGNPHFVHGAAVDRYGGVLTVCFGFSQNGENSLSEQLLYTQSADGGKSWTKSTDIAPMDGSAHSHGVFFRRGEHLVCFAPAFLGLGEPPVNAKGRKSIAFKALRMEEHELKDKQWRRINCDCRGFWPLNAPVMLDNGSLLISGCDEKWYAAAAVSEGEDLSRWNVVRPDTDAEVFTEAASWARGQDVLLLMRNETVMSDGRFCAALCASHDFGRSFGACELSNLPMATTKPFCGRLSDGRPYALFNASLPGAPRDRGMLMLGVGDGADGFTLDRLYRIDEGARTASGRRLALAYPSACEAEGKLYIVYSSESAPALGGNNNDIMLAIVNVSDL